MLKRTKLSIYCDKLIEAGWLAILVLVPVFFNIYSARTFEPDKITLMRSITLVMVLAWLIKIAEIGFGANQAGNASQEATDTPGDGKRGMHRLINVPLFLPTLLVVLAYLISTLLSISPTVSLWGSYQRMQGTYTALSYITVFALVASHLRTRAQLDRLMTTIIITSLPVGLYGIIQRYGLDPLPWAGDVQSRVASSLGNAIFVASYLIMAIPPIISRLLNSMIAILNEEEASWGNTILAAVYIFILAVDVIAVIFSGSRGPWLGLMAGTFFFILLALLLIYRRRGPDQNLTSRQALYSLLETAAPLVVGGVLAAVWYQATGPVSIGPIQSGVWGMIALGIMGGIGVAIVLIGIAAAVRRSGWRLWLNWIFLAVLIAGFLVAINASASPFFSDVRSMPTIGRLANLFQPGEGTGQVRMLIWEGVLNLISPHEPLGIPDEFKDNLNIIRPVVGYGPESMFNSFAKVYPSELAYAEARGSSADRSHNETFDFLAMMGIFGFIAYYFLIFGLFYYLLKAVGWIPNQAARRRLLVLLGVGGVLGAFVPRILMGDFVFSAVGLPAGMLAMISVYLVWEAMVDRPRIVEDGEEPDDNRVSAGTHNSILNLVAIGIFAALVGHLVEVHFVFSIAATYVYFWIYAGVVVAWTRGVFNEQETATAPVELTQAAAQVTPPETTVKRTSRRRRRPKAVSSDRPVTGPTETDWRETPEDWETWLGVFGLMIALILIAMVFDFVTGQFDVTRGNFSMLWMFGVTWIVGIAVGLGEVAVRNNSWRKPIVWGRAVLLYCATSLGYSLFYLLIHRWQLRPRTAATADPIQSVIQAANVVNGLFLLFYLFVGLLLLLIAAMLAVPQMRRQPFWRAANWWLYPVLVIVACVAILFKNVNVVRADILLKQGEQFRNQQQYDASIALHQWAVDLDPDEDFYYLMLALAYQMKAQDGNTPPEDRARAWYAGETIANQARVINRYNPDNTANLGRYYLTWAQVTPSDDPEQAARFEKAKEYFRKATYLAPQNVVNYNLLAQTYYILGQYQEAEDILQQSLALDSKYPQTYMLLGDVYGALGQPEQAAQAHGEAILRSPGSFADQFLDQRINFYLSYPQIQDIVDAFTEAIEKFPKDPMVPRTLGYIYSRMGDHQHAIIYYEQALTAGDNNLQTLLGLAGEYLAIEDYERAALAYEQAIQADPNNAQAYSNLGYAYARLGRLEEAIQANQQVIQLNPEDYVSYRNLVLLYRDTGQLDQAIQEAELLLQLTPENELGPSYLLVGNLYEAAGRPEEAIAAYESAVATSPDLAEAYWALGNLYLQQSRNEDALAIFQAAVDLRPDDYFAHQRLAETYYLLSQFDQALVEAKRALELAPEDVRPTLQQFIDQIEPQAGQNQ